MARRATPRAHPKANTVLRTSEASDGSAARYERLFESGVVGVIVADLAGRITDANDCFLDMLGYERADLPLRWDVMTPPEWRALDEAKVGELRATGTAQNWDKEYRSRTGVRIPITVCAALMDGTDGECIAVVLDRTATKVAEDAIRRSDERYQQKLRALALEVSLTAERERRRIAVGLHDQIGQNLAIARMRIDELQRGESDPVAAATLAELTDLLARTVESTRSLTFKLSPPLLFELGLDAALRGLARRIETRYGIRCRFEVDTQPRPLPADATIVVHQVVRELLFNVVKHACAANSGVSVTTAGEQIRIVVTDDGVGFEGSLDAKSGFGLFSARERLRGIGGSLEIESTPYQGTRVVVTAPLASGSGARG